MEHQENQFEQINCLICKSTAFLRYSNRGQFGLPTHVVICKNCGFSYLNPRWTKERYNYFYTVEYDNFYRPEVKKSNYQYDKYTSIKTILKRLDSLGLKPENPTNILDIGAGMGDALIYLKENIYTSSNYYAIEPSKHCGENLKSNNINILSTDVDSDWQINNENKFDLIIMRHVLEHFLDPVSVLQKVSKVLKPTGVLFVAVPNAEKPTRPLTTHYFRTVHVSYFSELSLTNAFSLSNIESLVMKGGDEFDQYEVFSVAKKTTEIKSLKIISDEYLLQKRIFDKIKRTDFYYNFKRFVWKLLTLFKK